MLDFPTSPSNGDTFTQNGREWIYNSSLNAWDLASGSAIGGNLLWESDGDSGYLLKTGASPTTAIVIDKDHNITGGSVGSGITTGLVDAFAINTDGSIHSSQSAVSVQDHATYYNPNGTLGSIGTHNNAWFFKLQSTNATMRIRSNTNAELFNITNEGAITGAASVPSNITSGLINAKVIDSSGVLHSARTSVSDRDHYLCYNTTGLIGGLQTNTSNQKLVSNGNVDLTANVGVTPKSCRLDSNGVWFPLIDNTQSLGAVSFRWSVVYAGTGTINTSDETEKSSLLPIDDAVLDVLETCMEAKSFQFLDAVAEKGAGVARIHFGYGVQTVKAAFETAGLDPARYGFFCHDVWGDKFEDQVTTPAVIDGDGNITTPEVVTPVKVLDAGDRYGFRYIELLCALGRVRDRQIATINTRLATAGIA